MFCFSMDSERLPSFDVTEFYIVLLLKKKLVAFLVWWPFAFTELFFLALGLSVTEFCF